MLCSSEVLLDGVGKAGEGCWGGEGKGTYISRCIHPPTVVINGKCSSYVFTCLIRKVRNERWSGERSDDGTKCRGFMVEGVGE